jgi:hypothetical protein
MWGNHPTLHKAMSEHFDQVHEEGYIETGVRHHHTSDAKHGRLENRYYYQASIPESLKELIDSWKGAKSIGQVHNITVRDGKECSLAPRHNIQHFCVRKLGTSNGASRSRTQHS